MSKELVISANRHETRVAMLEDDQVVEVYHQRENEYSLAGCIHKGRVTRVLPGMQSAFVDIGLERDAFLYVSDFFEDNDEYDKIVTSVEEKVLKLDRAPVAAAPPAAAAPVDGAGAGECPSQAAPAVAGDPRQRRSASGERLQPPASARTGERPERRGARWPRRWPRAEIDGGDRGGDRRGRRSRRGRGGRGGERRRRPRSAGFQVLFPAAGTDSAAGDSPRGSPGRDAGSGSWNAAARDVRSGAGRFLRAARRIAGQVHGRAEDEPDESGRPTKPDDADWMTEPECSRAERSECWTPAASWSRLSKLEPEPWSRSRSAGSRTRSCALRAGETAALVRRARAAERSRAATAGTKPTRSVALRDRLHRGRRRKSPQSASPEPMSWTSRPRPTKRARPRTTPRPRPGSAEAVEPGKARRGEETRSRGRSRKTKVPSRRAFRPA